MHRALLMPKRLVNYRNKGKGLIVASASDTGSGATLTASARAIFRLLALQGSATRPQLGQSLGLSRPTMSAAMSELERIGYVDRVGEVQGALGRKAAMYRVGTAAGHVIAVDAGSTHIRLRVSTIDCRLLHSRVYRLPSSQLMLGAEISAAVADEVAAAMAVAQADWGPLRALGIALPSRVVGPGEDTVATRQDELFSRFAPPQGAPLILENNVNCAAVAEHVYGAAQETATFAYVQVGLKIGMGLMLEGRLLRGRNGAAGEIGHLAFPLAGDARPEPGEIERYMGAEALMRRVRDGWPAGEGDAPADTSDLLARAESGSGAAQAAVTRHAEDIGAIVASCVAVVDPGIVVLGGGVGGHPRLAPRVEEVANRLSYPVEVRTSTLGSDATVLGIEKLVVDRALEGLVGELRA